MNHHGVSPKAPEVDPTPPTGGSGVQAKRRPPESARYDELKGRRVVVVLGHDIVNERLSPLVYGVLRWVDRYTVGLLLDEVEGIGKRDQVWIVSKSHIVMLGEA